MGRGSLRMLASFGERQIAQRLRTSQTSIRPSTDFAPPRGSSAHAQLHPCNLVTDGSFEIGNGMAKLALTWQESIPPPEEKREAKVVRPPFGWEKMWRTSVRDERFKQHHACGKCSISRRCP